VANHLAKDWQYIDKTLVHVSPDGTVDGNDDPDMAGDARARNSTLLPNAVGAATDFAYLTTDGSDDAPYLDAGG
jgi:hypothetical protein